MEPQRVGGPKPRKIGEPKGGAPKGGAPEGGHRMLGPRRVGGPKFRAFFSPLPPQFSFFLPSLGSVLVKFWWCLKRRDPQICTFAVLKLSCEAPAAPKQGEQKKKSVEGRQTVRVKCVWTWERESFVWKFRAEGRREKPDMNMCVEVFFFRDACFGVVAGNHLIPLR